MIDKKEDNNIVNPEKIATAEGVIGKDYMPDKNLETTSSKDDNQDVVDTNLASTNMVIDSSAMQTPPLATFTDNASFGEIVGASIAEGKTQSEVSKMSSQEKTGFHNNEESKIDIDNYQYLNNTLDKKEEEKINGSQKKLIKAKIKQSKAEIRQKEKQIKEKEREAREKTKMASLNLKEEKKDRKNREALLESEKESLKTERKIEKTRQKELKKSLGKGKFKVATIVLSIVAVVLIASTIVLASTTVMYKERVDKAYNQSYYQFIDSLNNLETTLSKSLVTKELRAQSENLIEASNIAMTASMSYGLLPESDKEAYKIMGYLNQVFDYTKTLGLKLSRGESLTQEDKDNLKNIYQINVQIKDYINSTFSNKAKSGKAFEKSRMMTGGMESNLTEFYGKMTEDEVKIPTLIYDGPFSDIKEQAEEKETEVKVTKEEAEKTAQKILEGKEDFKFVQEIQIKGMTVYVFEAKEPNETRVYTVQIDANLGLPVEINAYREVKDKNFDEKTLIEKCLGALEFLGFKDIKEVWAVENENLLTVNFAYAKDDVIFYNRLVKVKIAMDNGEILGIEGVNYIKNKEEISLTPNLDEKQARSFVQDNFEIENTRLAVIPVGRNLYLSYEFQGKFEGLDFFVYIDAESGRQLNVLRVVDGKQGKMLI